MRLLQIGVERADEWCERFVNTKIHLKISWRCSRWCEEDGWTGWEKTRGDGMHSTRTSTALFMIP